MVSLTPRPLAPDLPLVAVLRHLPAGPQLGLWLRSLRRPVRLLARRSRQLRVVLVDSDLGRLLRWCTAIAVQLGPEIVVASSEDLIRVRALRVVAGLPYLPSLDVLRALFPDSLGCTESLEIPLHRRSAEEVLAVCATARVPILLSRVVYGALRDAPTNG